MAATISHRHIGAVERLRIIALRRAPRLSVDDQALAIINAWKADRKPGLAYFFHAWSDHAPIEDFDDRQHRRDVRVALEAQGFILGD